MNHFQVGVREVKEPSGLLVIKSLGLSEIDKVFMIGKNLYQEVVLLWLWLLTNPSHSRTAVFFLDKIINNQTKKKMTPRQCVLCPQIRTLYVRKVLNSFLHYARAKQAVIGM